MPQEMQKARSVAFKFLIQKAEASESDDHLYVEGVATTPNVDLDGEAMSEEAIAKMVEQVNTGKIPLVNEHGRGWDDRLGDIVKGWMDERHQLHIRARLDAGNPTALHLYDSLKKGRQLGLSVAGNVIESVQEIAEGIGKQVRKFIDILLTEISVTQSPANFDTWLVAKGGWQGVISKSIKELTNNSTEDMNVKKSEGQETAAVEEKKEEATATAETTSTETTTEEVKTEAAATETAAATTETATTEAATETTETITETTQKSTDGEAAAMTVTKEDLMTMMTKCMTMMKSMMDGEAATEETSSEAAESEKTQKSAAAFKVPEAMIQKEIQSRWELLQKSNVKLVGGYRRLEEQVRAIAKSVEEMQNAPLDRKAIVVEAAVEVKKNFAGNAEEEKTTDAQPTAPASFADTYKQIVGAGQTA